MGECHGGVRHCVGGFSSLALDAPGGLHVAYEDGTTHDVKYAYRPACDEVSSPPTCGRPAF